MAATSEAQVGEVAAYYAAMTDRYLNYSGASLGWHFGLWDESTCNVQDALLRSNQLVADGCDLGPGKVVLDAGSGIGGLAIHLAAESGVQVVGITVCDPHLEVAARFARERGVESLVEFRHGDFMDLEFEDESIDFVFNQETLCYAPDPQAYLRGVLRVLKPGGRWQAVDGFRSELGLTEQTERYHRETQQGWKVPPLRTWRDVEATLGRVGFEQVRVRDLSAMAHPTARALAEQGLMHQLRRKLAPPGEDASPLFDDHMAACAAFSQGLLEGAFTYHFVGGTKPRV